jgi:hypothetical protein
VPEHLALVLVLNGLLPGNVLLDKRLRREQGACSPEQDQAWRKEVVLAGLARQPVVADLINVLPATADLLAIAIASPEISARTTGTTTAINSTTGRVTTTTAIGAGDTATGATTTGGALPRGLA